ncbi:hypothetical protein AMATHDRAFT_49130 [Amanita thiersii Skay4041]|uniref:Uncharacterized protein n=1 Tax=Amanita thiersii Skay4041 TaxID=703135 RepID=A0A2A9NHY6_9AGAR|nr:hypothetical protein AMATHDRAFT_49130 [Amanita thiersii Skay4041]
MAAVSGAAPLYSGVMAFDARLANAENIAPDKYPVTDFDILLTDGQPRVLAVTEHVNSYPGGAAIRVAGEGCTHHHPRTRGEESFLTFRKLSPKIQRIESQTQDKVRTLHVPYKSTAPIKRVLMGGRFITRENQRHIDSSKAAVCFDIDRCILLYASDFSRKAYLAHAIKQRVNPDIDKI